VGGRCSAGSKRRLGDAFTEGGLGARVQTENGCVGYPLEKTSTSTERGGGMNTLGGWKCETSGGKRGTVAKVGNER